MWYQCTAAVGRRRCQQNSAQNLCHRFIRKLRKWGREERRKRERGGDGRRKWKAKWSVCCVEQKTIQTADEFWVCLYVMVSSIVSSAELFDFFLRELRSNSSQFRHWIPFTTWTTPNAHNAKSNLVMVTSCEWNPQAATKSGDCIVNLLIDSNWWLSFSVQQILSDLTIVYRMRMQFVVYHLLWVLLFDVAHRWSHTWWVLPRKSPAPAIFSFTKQRIRQPIERCSGEKWIIDNAMATDA